MKVKVVRKVDRSEKNTDFRIYKGCYTIIGFHGQIEEIARDTTTLRKEIDLRRLLTLKVKFVDNIPDILTKKKTVGI